MLFKNVASQKIHIYAYDSTTGAAKTGDAANITAYVSLDGTANAIDDTNPAEVDATNMPGIYCFDLTQAETNCNAFALYAKSSTSNIRIEPIIGFTTGEAATQTGDAYAVVTNATYGLDKLARTGADSDTLETLSDQIDAVATAAELAKVPKSDGSTTWNATALASIQQEATDALNAYDPPTKTEQDTAFTEIKGATFNGTTDTLEAIRDRGDSAWVTATGFGTSTFDPATDKVYLADGAHGGSAATVTLKSIVVDNSEGDAVHFKSTAANKMALKLEGAGTGNSHALYLNSTNGSALAGASGSHGVSITSSAGNGMVIAGATGDIVADITGDLSGAVGSVTSAVTINSNADITAILQDTGTTLDGKINAIDTVVDLIEDIVRNKMEVVEATGAATLYKDDSTTPLLTNTVTSAAGTTTRTRLA